MIIYKITNKINGKVYIGQTIRSLKARWYEHCNDERRTFYRAIKKYGKENFIVEQIDSAETQQELDIKEGNWIAFYDSTNKTKGYNLSSGGEHPMITDEFRQKCSDAHKGILHTEESKRKIGNAHRGKIVSEETRRKISEAHKGKTPKPISEETRRKKSEASKGEKNPMYGRPVSEERRLKQSIAMKGKLVGEKNPNWGKSPSEDTRKKISNSLKGKFVGENGYWCGKKMSDEIKHKMSVSHKGIHVGGKNPRARKIVCVETGEVFNCMKDAAVCMNIDASAISQVCRGVAKSAKGYHWRYVS